MKFFHEQETLYNYSKLSFKSSSCFYIIYQIYIYIVHLNNWMILRTIQKFYWTMLLHNYNRINNEVWLQLDGASPHYDAQIGEF